MKRSYASALALAIAALSAGHALAADPVPAKTREQVRAELAQAQRNGDILPSDHVGLTVSQAYPHRNAQPDASRTREQVRAEARAALRSGPLTSSVHGLRSLTEASL